MVTAPPLFNYGQRCPGFLVEMDGFEPPRFLQNRFTVCRLQPLGHISKKGRATVAGPSAPKRKYPGDVALKLYRLHIVILSCLLFFFAQYS